MEDRPTPRSRSIRSKLILLITGLSLLALALAGTFIIIYETSNFRAAMVRELTIQAEIIGANSVVTLSYAALDLDLMSEGDEPVEQEALVTEFEAQETLNTFHANQHVRCAGIYSKSEGILSRYIRSGEEDTLPPTPGLIRSVFTADHLVIVRPIIDAEGERYGTVYIESDLEELSTRIRGFSLIIGGVVLACFLIVLGLSVWLEKIISTPILSLAKTAQVITEKKDYSLRAESRSHDEVGILIEAFNEMVARIQHRDSELQTLTAELSAANRTLEQKVEERTADMARATDEAREARDRALEANRAKSLFLANMSHEIRTPMNAIIGLTELSLESEPSARTLNYLTRISSSASSLLEIINDILDFSKIEAGKLVVTNKEFCLRETLINLADLVSVQAELKGLELLVDAPADVPCALTGDPVRLQQVLTNLTNNAVKFTAQGEIVIKAELLAADESTASIRFSVRDTGIGIRPEIIPTLFESFTQADESHSRRYEGTGLGLTIVKRLVELMGGAVHVESTLGVGSTFSFVLDFERQTCQHAVPTALPEELLDLRALVVDDNLLARQILVDILTSFAIRCDTATSGEEALNKLKEAPVDDRFKLVLLDWRMPGEDGFTTATKIKAEHRIYSNPKIIMVTAHGHEAILKQADAVGLDGLLVKPVSQSTLFDCILNAFGKRHASCLPSTVISQLSPIAQTLTDAKILLVEDNQINQEIAHEMLLKAGATVHLAGNGIEAVQAVTEREFDVVLMDIQMPHMDGYEATKLIRSKPQFATLPIFAVTAHAMQGDRERCIAAGMNDYMTKPINAKMLVTALARLMADDSPHETEGEAGQVAGTNSRDDAIPGLDLDRVLKLLGGNRQLMVRILRSFSLQHSAAAEEILTAWETGQHEKARERTHAIKGLAANIAATDLHQAAVALESAFETGAPDDVSQQITHFREALDKTVESASAIADAGSESPEAEPKPGSVP